MSRRAALLAASLASFGALTVFGFGPAVRSVARSAAERRHLVLQIEGVRPGWFSVRLLGVLVRPEAAPSISARVGEARIRVTLGLHTESLDLRDVALELRGPVDRVRDEVAAWRALPGPSPNAMSASATSTPTVRVDNFAVDWRDGDSAVPFLELGGMDADWDRKGVRWAALSCRLRWNSAEITMSDSGGYVDSGGRVMRARAKELVVALVGSDHQGIPSPPSPAPTVPEQTGSAEPGAPLLPLPDTRKLHARLAALVSLLSDRLGEGADVGVDSLTWKISRPGEVVAFTLGPGPLALTRTDGGFEIKYSTDAKAATTPLAVRAALPKRGDSAISLEGGPVSLSLLGVQEGAAGLIDVPRITIAGKAEIVLAEDGSALTFDGEGGARGLSISSPRLALDVVRGLDVQIRARGAATAEGELRVDDLAANVGALHVSAGGLLEQRADHVAAGFHFEIPRAGCQSLLDSLPSALLPALQGTQMSGIFGAAGRFGFDTRNLDALELEYEVNDQCRMMRVPPELVRERFAGPFSHRIYLPDGTIAEETTGPGTDNWTPLDEISRYMQVAVLTTEDGAFPKHHGFNRASIRLSIIANLKARRFARGASTITMQLAKNLFLSRDKTLSRKLEEVVLTDYLEQTFSKDELMELYLNVIEFGPGVYGITAAAEHYFGRTPGELDLAECLFLSSLLPAPLRYGAMRDGAEAPEGWMRMIHTLMQIAHHNGRITDAELAESENEEVIFWHGGERPTPRPPVAAKVDFGGNADDVSTAPPLDSPPSGR